MRDEPEIPYVEGYLSKTTLTHPFDDKGFYRLYMFPTKDGKSTYYLFILISDIPVRDRDKIFLEVYNFVGQHK